MASGGFALDQKIKRINLIQVYWIKGKNSHIDTKYPLLRVNVLQESKDTVWA
jgi:hypothetical protein